MRLIAGCLLALAASAAPAQERLTPEQFLDIAAGRTLTFDHYPSGARVGVEQFLSRVQSVWTRDDGSCTYGEITTDPLYICFVYDDDPGREHCWVPFTVEGRLIVRSPGGDMQEVTQVSDAPVGCTDAPMS